MDRIMRCVRWFRRVLTFVLACVPALALPAVGTPAPPLDFTQLLQAPAGAKADWSALRGKVVVLEFWATWCGPCVAAVPHLNELAASVDPNKVQFISVDDESPKVIEGFLAKRKMAGWVGIDTTGKVFQRYGVVGRPTTIIVDPKGRIEAVTYPDFVSASQLAEVAAGKAVKFRAAMALMPAMLTAKADTQEKPLFEISIARAKAGDRMSMEAGDGRLQFFAAKPDFLLTYVYDVPEDRLIWKGKAPEDAYDMTVLTGGIDSDVLNPLLQGATAAALHLHVEAKKVTEAAWVLTATPAAGKLLLPTASTGGSMAIGVQRQSAGDQRHDGRCGAADGERSAGAGGERDGDCGEVRCGADVSGEGAGGGGGGGEKAGAGDEEGAAGGDGAGGGDGEESRLRRGQRKRG